MAAQMLDPSLASQLQGTGPGGMPTQADAAQAQAKQAEAESQRQDILTKVMAPDAKERLARISLVKPDKVPPAAPRAARCVDASPRPAGCVHACGVLRLSGLASVTCVFWSCLILSAYVGTSCIADLLEEPRAV